jgi:hypothetical protein
LAAYSSDGEKLGQVTHVGTVDGQPAVRAELGGFLDVAPLALIPREFQQADRWGELLPALSTQGEYKVRPISLESRIT